MNNWNNNSIFYHFYPLGSFGAPQRNDFISSPIPRLMQIEKWLPHLERLHINAIYLGPVFESTAHGYDTANYYLIDRRLGDNQTLKEMVQFLHEHGIRVILDGVFNHVGRDFFAFKDLLQNGENSSYLNWFSGIDFSRQSPCGDPFFYEGWNNNYDLVKLNLQNQAICDHLFKAVELWMKEFNIDGLRIDAADCVDMTFLQRLYSRCKTQNPDFWIMGEVIHGDYSKWINAEALDSVTNYECFKGLYSSHVDRNYFEIAYSLNRQFGEYGIYRHFLPYSFVDNHDVNRLSSNLKNPLHAYPTYCLLFCMPGIPSIYYGSEWGITGERTAADDHILRPYIDPENPSPDPTLRDLPDHIARLAQIRLQSPALQSGDYHQVFVAGEQFVFMRETQEENILVVVNSAQQPVSLEISVSQNHIPEPIDLLSGEKTVWKDNLLVIQDMPPNSGKIIKIR